MSKVYAFLADGFEEVEALAVIDVLRRADVDVTTFSVMNRFEVNGSHNIIIKADKLIEEADWSEADVLFLPGGMPGTLNLGACSRLTDQIKQFFKEGKRIAAICAAPSVLGRCRTCERRCSNRRNHYDCKRNGIRCRSWIRACKIISWTRNFRRNKRKYSV